MCGIIGCAGRKKAQEFLMQGLKKLEYRGYDSAGLAVLNGDELKVVKAEGELNKLAEKLNSRSLEGSLGIGHTRWATHGIPSDENSHPHQDCQERFALVHNGIIENYQELQEDLEAQGHTFSSDTDTEVLAHLIEEIYEKDMISSLQKLKEKTTGSYALAVIDRKNPGKIYALRQDSPLVIGLGEKENYLASDMPALLNVTSEFKILEDGEMAVIDSENVRIISADNQTVKRAIFKADWDAEMVEKKGYEHFMLKEIYEQPIVARRILGEYLDEYQVKIPELNDIWDKDIERIMITACGTAYYAGLVGKHVLAELAHLPVEVEIASELRYQRDFLTENTLVIVVSQSGETADSLAALKKAQAKGCKVLAITNTPGSSIARSSDVVINIMAGPEIAVASTKAYLAMLIAFYLLALKLAELREELSRKKLAVHRRELLRLPEKITATLNRVEKQCQKIADYLKDQQSIFFIGRNLDYSLSLEGALKLKEISYLHAESYPAGELKHGTLALVEEGVPVIAIMTQKELAPKTLSNIKEVTARNGRVIAVVSGGIITSQEDLDEVIEVPLCNGLWAGALTVLPLQLLAYHTAKILGRSIDKPRNLAKSVTVE